MNENHFIELAMIMREAREDLWGGTPAELVLDEIRDNLMIFCKAQNSNFDYGKFYNACEPAQKQ